MRKWEKKNEMSNVPKGSQVKVNLNRTSRIPNNMIVNCIGIGTDEEEGSN